MAQGVRERIEFEGGERQEKRRRTGAGVELGEEGSKLRAMQWEKRGKRRRGGLTMVELFERRVEMRCQKMRSRRIEVAAKQGRIWEWRKNMKWHRGLVWACRYIRCQVEGQRREQSRQQLEEAEKDRSNRVKRTNNRKCGVWSKMRLDPVGSGEGRAVEYGWIKRRSERRRQHLENENEGRSRYGEELLDGEVKVDKQVEKEVSRDRVCVRGADKGQTEKQTEKQTKKQTEKQAEIQTEIQTEKEAEKQTEKQADGEPLAGEIKGSSVSRAVKLRYSKMELRKGDQSRTKKLARLTVAGKVRCSCKVRCSGEVRCRQRNGKQTRLMGALWLLLLVLASRRNAVCRGKIAVMDRAEVEGEESCEVLCSGSSVRSGEALAIGERKRKRANAEIVWEENGWKMEP